MTKIMQFQLFIIEVLECFLNDSTMLHCRYKECVLRTNLHVTFYGTYTVYVTEGNLEKVRNEVHVIHMFFKFLNKIDPLYSREKRPLSLRLKNRFTLKYFQNNRNVVKNGY